MRDRKRMELHGRGCGKELEGIFIIIIREGEILFFNIKGVEKMEENVSSDQERTLVL